jgi:Rha family phage regulatory protein
MIKLFIFYKKGVNMNNLITKEIQLTSLELAEITGKRHADVMRDIRNEIITLGEEIGQRIFAQSSYTNSQNKEQPCYQFGRKGAMQLALKYDAKTRYKVIEKLEELEKGQALQTGQLSPQLQLLINMELEQKQLKADLQETKEDIQNMRDVISLDTTSWREGSRKLIVKIAQSLGGNGYIKDINKEAYTLLNKRLGVDVKIRLTNKRRRMADEGVCRSKRDKLNYLDVIADDKKLVEGYVAIVKEMSIKYGVTYRRNEE